MTFANDITIHGKNDFAETSKILAKYRSENNFVGLSKLFFKQWVML